MPRYQLTLEYDGGPYRGFQAQGKLPTVQAAVEAAVHAFCGEAVRLHAAGRTDTGVHATGQVVHVDLVKDWRAGGVVEPPETPPPPPPHPGVGAPGPPAAQ